MGTQTQEVLSMIGAMQTLVENFPMNLLSSLYVKKYTSVMEFLMDVLGTLGFNDRNLLEYLITTVIAPKLNEKDLSKLDDTSAQFNSPFISALENGLKSTIAAVLAELLSCSIHPKVSSAVTTNGVKLPVPSIDPSNLLDTCPTSRVGKNLYNGVSSATTPNDLWKSTDLNAVLWYSLYKASGSEVGWSGKTGTDHSEICTFEGSGYRNITIRPNSAYTDVSLYQFNRDYLNSINILSPKMLITYLCDEFINGLPHVGVYYSISDIFTDAVLDNIVKTVVENDDMEINDCYYSFSNEDWDRMLDEHELSKYGAKRLNSETAGAIEIDKDYVLNALDSASSASTLHDQNTIITKTFYDVAATPSQDASVEISDGIVCVYNNNWINNLLKSIVKQIVKSVFTPKVMSIILTNYYLAGLINMTTSTSAVLDLLKQKILSLIAQVVKQVKDAIVIALMDLLTEKLLPLINLCAAKKILEKIEDHIELLKQALRYFRLFYFGSNPILTDIDNVNYADIVPQQMIPEQSPC